MEHQRYKDPEVKVHEELERLAAKHVGGPLGLKLLEYDPIAYPNQQLVKVYDQISPDPSLETIYSYATIASGENVHPGRFSYLVDSFKRKPDILTQVKELLDNNKNVAVATNHSQIQDVAIVQAALVCALEKPEIIPRNAIVISKLITRIQAFGLPAPQVINSLAHTFFSIPRTKSIFHSEIDEDIATLTNTSMVRELTNFLNEPMGKIVAIAPSGSTDERNLNGDRLQKLTLQRMSSGTAKLIASFDAVLPVAIWLEADEHRYSMSIGELKTHRKDDEAHELMEWIAQENSHLAGVTTEYEAERLGGIDKIRKLGTKMRGIAERLGDE